MCACPMCSIPAGNMEHILLTCPNLKPLRDEIETWLVEMGSLESVMDREMTLQGKNIDRDIVRYLLSEYKIEVWNHRNK